MSVHFAPPPPAAISRVLSRFDRDQLASFITVAIDLLDLADGETDLEDDDPAGDVLDQGEGVGDFNESGAGLLPDRPLYAVDQSSGPINYAECARDHRGREAGLVRNSAGGWRQPH